MNVLRWILFIPVGVLAALLIDFPLHFILYGILSSGENPFITPYPKLPELIISPLLRSFMLVFVSSSIAPFYKLRIAYIITCLWLFSAVITLILGYFKVNIGSIQFTLSYGGVPILMGIMGAFIGLYRLKE